MGFETMIFLTIVILIVGIVATAIIYIIYTNRFKNCIRRIALNEGDKVLIRIPYNSYGDIQSFMILKEKVAMWLDIPSKDVLILNSREEPDLTFITKQGVEIDGKERHKGY